MSVAAENIQPETLEFIRSLAENAGLSVDEYLRRLLPVSEQNLALRPDDLDELKNDLTAFAEGTKGHPLYQGTYAREDIYFDHD